ncbi:calcium-binding 39 [Paramuricea clavata]|uniref:Calcium-binding 39 n=1 Tax=Paramuricea clavata TaxID=317549 RepID=A0A7D9DFS1_PARCT|nr:calcium-binding 39 [Paramuricea clavata]
MPLFSSGKKNPAELVKALHESLNIMSKEQSGKKNEKALEDIGKYLAAMKAMLYGTGEQEPQTELVAQLSQEFYNNDTIQALLDSLEKMDFEAKKDVAQIFNNVLRRQIGVRSPTVEYIHSKSDILNVLVKGYENPDIALNCGVMLRECVRHESLANFILNDKCFYDFFVYVELSTFDIASDAFSSFKELLTRHKMICASFLDREYDKFFDHYRQLLFSENYVTKRQSIKLLGELLLDRHNFTVMTRFISNQENLKLMMNMLRDKSRNIQFEAFHVFKIFVANPNKTQAIRDILIKNKEKLVEFLENFHTDRTEDEQFTDEKTYLIKQIKELS